MAEPRKRALSVSLTRDSGLAGLVFLDSTQAGRPPWSGEVAAMLGVTAGVA